VNGLRDPRPAMLVLADGTTFEGEAIGADAPAAGEVVFNTVLSGYQEVITDPSYAGQIITFTYPHIGNYGVNLQDFEARRPFCRGVVVRDLARRRSSWRAEADLDEQLRAHGIPGIAGVDTRKLTRRIREVGAIPGAFGPLDVVDEAALREAATAEPGTEGVDLVAQVTTTEPYRLADGQRPLVVAYDFGIKHNILRMLVDRGCELTVVPAKTPAAEVLAQRPDGVFLSNGPGDPEPCDYAIAAIREFLAARVPIFGICLGHQLLALASGARTQKMKFGHHGANHPVQDLVRGTVMISSQNHGFAVDEASLPAQLRATHRSLFDGSLQGIERTDCPAFGFQGHPEASPGPHDVAPLFDHFIELMARHQGG